MSHFVSQFCSTVCEYILFTLSGKVRPGRDMVVFLSHSGGTKECVSAASQLLAQGVVTLSLTGKKGMYLLCVLTHLQCTVVEL